jgi:hypothetical protein
MAGGVLVNQAGVRYPKTPHIGQMLASTKPPRALLSIIIAGIASSMRRQTSRVQRDDGQKRRQAQQRHQFPQRTPRASPQMPPVEQGPQESRAQIREDNQRKRIHLRFENGA